MESVQEQFYDYSEGYNEESHFYDIQGLSYPLGKNPYKLIKYFIIALMLLIPAMIIIKTPSNHFGTASLAFLNVVFMGWVCYRLLKRGTVSILVPLLFLGMLLLSFPVAVLYFSIFNPEAYYTTLTGIRGYLEAGVRLQIAMLLFFIAYSGIVMYYLRTDNEVIQLESFSHIAVLFSVTLSASIYFIQALNVLGKIPGFFSYLFYGFFNYLYGVSMLVGAMFRQIPKIIKFIFVVVMGAAALFFTIGNARGMALKGIFIFFIGFLFFSQYSRKTKKIIILCLAFGLPLYLMIGNTTRTLLGTAGFEEGIGYRFKQLLRWREVAAQTSVVESTLGRLFFTGGHVIIADTPSRVPYRSFSLYKFSREMIESLIPQRFYYNPYYRHHGILVDYGMRVTEETSVSQSLPGSLWILGGYPFMFLGGLVTGLLHIWIIRLIRTNWARSQIAGLLYLGIILPTIFWGARAAFIQHWRDLVYYVIFAFLVSKIVVFFVGAASPESDEYYQPLGRDADQ